MTFKKITVLAIESMVCISLILTGCNETRDIVSDGEPAVNASDTAQASDLVPTTPDVSLADEPVEQSASDTVAVNIDFATDDILSAFDGYIQAAAPDADYDDTSVDVIFTTSAAARDFSITRLFHPDYFRNEVLLSQYELLPEEPIVFSMVFHGDIPSTGISYLDENDETKYFYLTISGEDGSLLLVETDSFEYLNAPSQKLFDLAGLFIPYTTLIPENEFSRENPPKPFTEYKAGTPLTYEELLHFAEMTDSSDDRFHISTEWVQEIHESGNSDGFLQDALWADINGDSTDEVVIILGRSAGGGSEGGSVLVYTEQNGAYCGVLRFYTGMQNECVLAEHDGYFYFVLMYPKRNLTDSDDEPKISGALPDTADTLSTGFGIQYFSENWAPEFLLVENGEAVVTESAWYWEMYYNNKY